MGKADRITLAEEYERVLTRRRRHVFGRVGFTLGLVALVLVLAYWIGFDIRYLYAHRGNLLAVVFGEMLSPIELWRQLEGDYPLLLPAAVETLAIAIVGTALGLPFAMLFGILAANNVTPSVIHSPVRMVLGGIRAVPSMVYALLFVILAGLGPVAGAMAIAIGTVGDLGRLFADEMEEIDHHPVEAVHSSGAGMVATTVSARIPQVTTAYVAWILFYLEINARKSSVLGIVGAGGIGFPLIMAFRARNYTRVMATILIILILIISVEFVANRLRDRVDIDRKTARLL